MRLAILAVGILIPLLLIADSTEWLISQDGLDSKQTPRLVTTAGGQAYVAYRDRGGRLLVGRPGASPFSLTDSGVSAAGLALEAVGRRIYAAWLEARPGAAPAIVLRAMSEDGTWSRPRILDTASRPLPRIRLGGGPGGEVAVVWLGDAPDSDQAADPEQPAPSTSNYHLYGRRSSDGGATWGEVQRLTAGYDSGFWPALTMNDGRLHLFADARREGKTHIVHARSDEARGWTRAESIASAGSLLLIAATQARGEPLVLWFGTDEGGFRLQSAVRDGAHWRIYRFPGSEEFDIGSLALAARDDQVYLAFSARSARTDAQPRKNHVYFARSLDGGVSWGPIRPLRHYPFDSTQDTFPQIALTGAGDLVVAWNDYRNIRGDLYFNRSSDGGASWLEQDRPVDRPGVTEDVLFPFVDNLQSANGGLYLLAARYRDDGFGVSDLYLHRLPSTGVAPARDLTSDLGSAVKLGLLQERVKAFWNALLAADYGAAYELFDPYFRLRMRRDDYVAQSGRVRHHSFVIQEAEIAGNLAQVEVRFLYEIPEMSLPRGGTYARPPTSATIRETWLFIDGQWHKEYHNEIGDFSFTRY